MPLFRTCNNGASRTESNPDYWRLPIPTLTTGSWSGDLDACYVTYIATTDAMLEEPLGNGVRVATTSPRGMRLVLGPSRLNPKLYQSCAELHQAVVQNPIAGCAAVWKSHGSLMRHLNRTFSAIVLHNHTFWMVPTSDAVAAAYHAVVQTSQSRSSASLASACSLTGFMSSQNKTSAKNEVLEVLVHEQEDFFASANDMLPSCQAQPLLHRRRPSTMSVASSSSGCESNRRSSVVDNRRRSGLASLSLRLIRLKRSRSNTTTTQEPTYPSPHSHPPTQH